MSSNEKLRYPYAKCTKVKYHSPNDLYKHCICDGFMLNVHGELHENSNRAYLSNLTLGFVDFAKQPHAFENFKFGVLPFPNSYGVLSSLLMLRMTQAISKASSHKFLNKLKESNITLIMSMNSYFSSLLYH